MKPPADFPPGLAIRIRWLDEHLVQVVVAASNCAFAGTASVYLDRNGLSELADTFRGFPTFTEDRRRLQLGNFEPGSAGGGVRLELSCRDRAAHVVLRVELRSDPVDTGGRSATADFVLRPEPAALDAFVSALRNMPLAPGAEASLRATDPPGPIR